MSDEELLPLRLVHKSVERQIMLGGGERELMLVSALLGSGEGFAISVSFGPWWGVPLGVLTVVALLFVVKRMGRADKRMSKVAMRHLKYRRFYPSRAHIHAELPPVKTYR